MKIIYASESLSLKDSVVVLGNFDGVHIAHQALIKKAVDIAATEKLKTVVYTFVQHPKAFFDKGLKLITTNSEKEKVFESLGVDILVYQNISSTFLSTSPDEFVRKIIVNQLGARKIIVGKHYTFGSNAFGDSEMLKNLSRKFGVTTYVEDLMMMDNQLVSSSNIREFVINGNPEKAAVMLGRKISYTGEIVHGNHIGSEIGFPTANIVMDSSKVVPKFGVYAAKVIIDEKEYCSVVNVGVKPTIGSDIPLIEAHVFGADGDFYGKNMTVSLCFFIREERKFESVNELKKQIGVDTETAMEYFSACDK